MFLVATIDTNRLLTDYSAADELSPADSSFPGANAEWTWIRSKYVTLKVSSEVLGYNTTKHNDWFDNQDAEARALQDIMHSTHLAWINDKCSSAEKAAYAHARSRAQTKLRGMKDQWWKAKSVALQAAADCHDLKAFYQALKTWPCMDLWKLVPSHYAVSTAPCSQTTSRYRNVRLNISRRY